jgi:hypothetical protein
MADLSRGHVGLFELDREQFSLRAGFVGLLAIGAAVAFLAVVGYAGVAAVLGAIITAISAGSGRLAPCIARGVAVATVGSLLTVVGVWSGERGWTAGLVVAVVTFAATIVVAFGKTAATAAFLLNLWLLLSLTFTASDHSLGGLAASFLAGGAFAVLLQPLVAHRRRRTAAPPGPGAEEPAAAPAGPRSAPLRAALRPESPLFQFAVVRALATGGTTALGWYLFDRHPYWAVLVAFVIIKSDPAESWAVGVHRAVGTVFGAAVGILVVQNVDSTPWLTFLLVVASMLMIAVQRANYAAFTFFLTTLLILSTRLVEGDIGETVWERVAATVLGVGIAFAVTALVLSIARRRRPDTATTA